MSHEDNRCVWKHFALAVLIASFDARNSKEGQVVMIKMKYDKGLIDTCVFYLKCPADKAYDRRL